MCKNKCIKVGHFGPLITGQCQITAAGERIVRWIVVLLAVLYVLSCELVHAGNYPLAHIYLLTDEQPASDGTESVVTRKLRQQLRAYPELKYQLHYVSWPKALAEVARRSDALVVGLYRTPQRERHYQWLIADAPESLHLYCLKQQPLCDLSIAQLVAKPAVRIACPALSAHCEMLHHRGFSSQIIEVRLAEQNSLERMLLAKRVDFIAVSEPDIVRRMALLHVDSELYRQGPQVAELRDYLAGGPNLDPKLRALLTETR